MSDELIQETRALREAVQQLAGEMKLQTMLLEEIRDSAKSAAGVLDVVTCGGAAMLTSPT